MSRQESNNAELKQKRVRHLKSLMVKNLQLVEDGRFAVWFTMHLNRASNAFYCGEKKENERSPKWNLANMPKLAARELLIRVWVKDSKLRLLIEMEVNLSCLIYLSESNLSNLSTFENFFIFEMFDCLFTEPLFSLGGSVSGGSDRGRTTLPQQRQQQQQSSRPQQQHQQLAPTMTILKNSYTLNLMMRLHDYQRVIGETRRKIAHLKQMSVGKFEASARLRHVQRERELRSQQVALLRHTYDELESDLERARGENASVAESVRQRHEALTDLIETLRLDKLKYSLVEKSLDSSLNTSIMLKNELFTRQKHLICELAKIFPIQRLVMTTTTSSSNRAASSSSTLLPSYKLKILNSIIRLWPTSSSFASATSSSSSSSSSAQDSNYDRENAIAMGHISHCVQMLAMILGIPLRYPIVYRASKSYVVESVVTASAASSASAGDGGSGGMPLVSSLPRMLALFRQSSTSQEELFLYAVSLLNADLVQIRVLYDAAAHRNVDHSDLLVNLKWIFDFFNKS